MWPYTYDESGEGILSDQELWEAWEAGTNTPSGAASRILNMMELDAQLTKTFPFVKL